MRSLRSGTRSSLGRAALDAPAAPARLVHLGLGAFHRAHQAYFTDVANEIAAEPAGIAAFTGRRPDMAVALAAQECLYTVVIRGPERDERRIVRSISEVHEGTDSAAWRRLLSAPEVAALTLTVTEPAYHRDDVDGVDRKAPAVVADLRALAEHRPPSTVPGRIVDGLRSRRDAGVGGLAVLSCDNLPRNGQILRAAVVAMAETVEPSLADWISQVVRFPDSMVDRITPRTRPRDVEELAAHGLTDAVPVITEPFAEWIIAGRAPVGVPDWAGAGVRFVDDVTPFEQRKLRLLNGGHLLLAYAGSILGARSIDEAVRDRAVGGWLEEWWQEAGDGLSFSGPELAAYREVLLERFSNPRIRHGLEQIASSRL